MAATRRSDPAISALHESLISLSQLGSCNYRTLVSDCAGSPTPTTCGCQRFWLDDARGERPWCACGHHACFHELSEPRPCNQSFSHDPMRHEGPRYSASPSDIASTWWKGQSSDSYCHRQSKQGIAPDPIAQTPCQRPQPPEPSPTEVNTPSPRFDVRPHAARSFSVPSQSEKRPVSIPSSSHYDPHHTVGLSEQPANMTVSTPLQNRISLPLELQNILHSHSRRLEALETCSFSQVPADEIQQIFEVVDGRLMDLETWRADENSRIDCDHAHGVQADSLQSDEASQRVADIEDRLQYLEGAFPSYSYPWELEVVLLPWGESLRGIWVKPQQEPSNPTPEPKEWTGLPSQTSGSYAYNSEGVCWMPTWSLLAEDGLTPKAPGPNSVIFRRLRSRGLVGKVTITDGGSHHIWSSITSVFSPFISANMIVHAGITSALPESQGLKQPIIPLRKVKKSSQLQFLATHEMVSPALWDFNFLKSGVLMKVKGSYRLYCTTPDAYVQADHGQWSWARLQKWHPPSGDVCAETTIESPRCWEPHPILDQDSAPSSPSSRQDESTRGGYQSSIGSDDDDIQLGSSPPQASSSTREFVMNSSFPIFSKDAGESMSTKRCLSYLEDDTRHHKRGRYSKPVEAERYLTPWSSEPESPPAAEGETGSVSCGAESPYMGPQYGYATPHSHSAAQYYLEAAGDTEADSESDASMQSGHSDNDSEKEWEGVVDDDVMVQDGSSEKMMDMEDAVLNDDVEELDTKSDMFSPGEEDADKDYEESR